MTTDPKRPRTATPDSDSDNRDSTSVLGAPGTVGGQGREGGRLARDIGTRDELKRATERPGGATRVTKKDEREDPA